MARPLSIADKPTSLKPRTTLGNNHRRISPDWNPTPQLRSRALDKVPGLPDGWKAVYGVITDLKGIPRPSERRILKFYDQILTAAYENVLGPDSVRKTFHLGNLALQFQSRNRQQTNVTRELVIATIGLLLHFAETGFIDLFKASLEHVVDDLGVYIVLAVTDRLTDGFVISGRGS
ncbi:MAG: hypothetical protein Q9169_006489 [Polycauliona sp. 2 TL-2023]